MAIATPGTPEAAAVIQQEALKVAKPELSANEAAKQKLALVHKEQGARAALEDAKKALDAQKTSDPEKQFTQGITQDRTKQAVDSNIQGSTPEQDIKRKDTADVLERHDAFATGGYDAAGADKGAIETQVGDRLISTPWLNEAIKGMTPDQGKQFIESFVKDPQYVASYNRLLQERANYRITDADKQARWDELKKSNPAATWEEAAGQLEQEWQENIKRIPGDAATELMMQHLENAMTITEKDAAELDSKTKALAAEQGMQMAEGVMEKFRRRWENRGIMNIDDERRNDFNTYAKGGLEAVLKRLPVDQLSEEDRNFILNNPAVRAAYDKKFAESFINQRLRTGKLSKDNIYSIVDDPALGEKPEDRVTKLQTMMESHKVLQDIIKKGQADGTIQRDLWDKMKGLSPLKRRNALMAILSLLVLPGSVAVVGITHSMGK